MTCYHVTHNDIISPRRLQTDKSIIFNEAEIKITTVHSKIYYSEMQNCANLRQKLVATER